MSDDTAICLTIDSSLLEEVNGKLAGSKYGIPPEDAITHLVASILDNSPYPIQASQIGKRRIQLRYRIRSFSQPIFE
jgi:hypothetical protein